MTRIVGEIPAWGWMWVLAGGMFFAAKWMTWRRALREGVRPGRWRSLGYLFAWPGMGARAFLDPGSRPPAPGRREWAAAALKTAAGGTLLWVAARWVPGWTPLLQGWVGLLGLVLVLHFGLFHLAALLWRRAGVEAYPIMRSPALASSVGEFWGRRWNVAFRELAHDLVFLPWRRRLGARGAALLAFAASGLAHDLVLSVPAGGGFGLPTAYFLLQGAAVAVERSAAGRRIGMGGGWTGRVFLAALTAFPAWFLFHPPFLTRVAVPFLEAIRAL